MPGQGSPGKIRVAAVVDQFRATSRHGPINHRAAVQGKKIEPLRLARAQNLIESAKRLALGDALAGVLDHLPAARDILGGEDSSVVDWRAGDAEAKPCEAVIYSGADSSAPRRGRLSLCALGSRIGIPCLRGCAAQASERPANSRRNPHWSVDTKCPRKRSSIPPRFVRAGARESGRVVLASGRFPASKASQRIR